MLERVVIDGPVHEKPTRKPRRCSRWYVLLRLEDAQLLAKGLHLRSPLGSPTSNLVDNLLGESGADVEEIATELKALSICAACSIEGQSEHCGCLAANRLGRRLARLINRATLRR